MWHVEDHLIVQVPNDKSIIKDLNQDININQSINDDIQEYDISINKRIKYLKNYLIKKGCSIQTIKNYCNHIEHFLNYSNGCDDYNSVNSYLLYLLNEQKCSHSYVNQAVSAIKIDLKLHDKLNGDNIVGIVRPKKEKVLPKVLSQAEVKLILDSVINSKHKTMLMLAYSCGLRVSEVAQMQIINIDSSRMIVLIKQGKGRKDRISILSEKMLIQLREY